MNSTGPVKSRISDKSLHSKSCYFTRAPQMNKELESRACQSKTSSFKVGHSLCVLYQGDSASAGVQLYIHTISKKSQMTEPSCTCCSCWCHFSWPTIWRWKMTGAAVKLNNTGSPILRFLNGCRSEFSCDRDSTFINHMQNRAESLLCTLQKPIKATQQWKWPRIPGAYLHPEWSC